MKWLHYLKSYSFGYFSVFFKYLKRFKLKEKLVKYIGDSNLYVFQQTLP